MKCQKKDYEDLDLLENSMMEHPTKTQRRMSRLPSVLDPSEMTMRRSDTLTKRSLTTGQGKRSKLGTQAHPDVPEVRMVPLLPRPLDPEETEELLQ